MKLLISHYLHIVFSISDLCTIPATTVCQRTVLQRVYVQHGGLQTERRHCHPMYNSTLANACTVCVTQCQLVERSYSGNYDCAATNNTVRKTCLLFSAGVTKLTYFAHFLHFGELVFWKILTFWRSPMLCDYVFNILCIFVSNFVHADFPLN